MFQVCGDCSAAVRDMRAAPLHRLVDSYLNRIEQLQIVLVFMELLGILVSLKNPRVLPFRSLSMIWYLANTLSFHWLAHHVRYLNPNQLPLQPFFIFTSSVEKAITLALGCSITLYIYNIASIIICFAVHDPWATFEVFSLCTQGVCVAVLLTIRERLRDGDLVGSCALPRFALHKRRRKLSLIARVTRSLSLVANTNDCKSPDDGADTQFAQYFFEEVPNPML
jgi:hypothetical protein